MQQSDGAFVEVVVAGEGTLPDPALDRGATWGCQPNQRGPDPDTLYKWHACLKARLCAQLFEVAGLAPTEPVRKIIYRHLCHYLSYKGVQVAPVNATGRLRASPARLAVSQSRTLDGKA
jgi:hypothetical protein